MQNLSCLYTHALPMQQLCSLKVNRLTTLNSKSYPWGNIPILLLEPNRTGCSHACLQTHTARCSWFLSEDRQSRTISSTMRIPCKCLKDPLMVMQTFNVKEHLIKVQKHENKPLLSSSFCDRFLLICLPQNTETGCSVPEMFIMKLSSLLSFGQQYKVSRPRLQNAYFIRNFIISNGRKVINHKNACYSQDLCF